MSPLAERKVQEICTDADLPTIEVTGAASWTTRARVLAKRAWLALRGLGRTPDAHCPPPLYVASSAETAPAPPYPPMIDAWKVLGVIASGATATVYRVVPAWAPHSTEHYALKLHSDRQASERDARSRFQREIRILKGLKHRNVVGMVEAGEFRGRLYIVMELVEGRNLRQALDKQKPQMTGKLDWCIQITRALAATHRRGVVHRDLKPENILTTRVGVIKLADFGLAVQSEQQKVTRAGFLVGTPAYMAPESLLGKETDGRSDLYSLGVILYEIFTGAMPFEARTVNEYIDAHLNAAPVALRRRVPALPLRLEKCVLRLLHKNPENRFQSADEVREELEAVLAEVVGVSPAASSAAVVA